MRRGKDASLKALISAMAEAESKSYYEEQENALNDLSGLLKTFLNRDDSPERVRIRKDYEAGAALTGKGLLSTLFFQTVSGVPSGTGCYLAGWSLKRTYTKHTEAGQADQPDEWLQACSGSSPWTCQVYQSDV